MGLGIRRFFNRAYVGCIVLNFSLRKYALGFENANMMLQYVDKRAVVPILRNYGARIGPCSDIESSLIVHNCFDYLNLLIGANCHIGKDVFFDLTAPVVIEDSVTVSMRTTIITHVDVGRSPLKSCGVSTEKKGVTLKEGCYIGAEAVILHGVTVGQGAIVGAGAVVTSDVPSSVIAAGVPARIIRSLGQ